MKFRRIMCIILSAVTLFTCFAFTALAAEETTPDVVKELSGLMIDGEAFSTDKHLPEVVNEDGKPGLGIITVKETGYGDGEARNLYIYIYNPSGQVLNDGDYNRVQIGINDDCELYELFGIEIMSRSKDQKFLKVRIVDSSLYGDKLRAFTKQENENSRVYNIVSLLFEKDGKKLVWGVSQAFTFSGTGDNITCQAQKIGSLEVELHDTNWISPSSAARVDGKPVTIYDHYEIHSVYFKVPKKYWDKYEYLFSIDATYDEVHLTPIIVTREGDKDFSDEKGVITKNAIKNGITLTVDGEPDVYDLFWSHSVDNVNYKFIYTENSTTRRLAMNGMNIETVGTCYDSLAYYFATLPDSFDYSEEGAVAKAVVNSNDLRDYFWKQYRDSDIDNNKLYSEYISNQTIGIDATQFNAEGIYQMGGAFKETLTDMNDLERWWTRLWISSNGYLFEEFKTEANYIDVISNPQDYDDISDDDSTRISDASNEFFISEADVVDFSKVCKEAVQEDCYVVLLRLGLKDYSCHVVEDVAEQALGFGVDVALAIDKWAYLNISVAQLVFKSNEGMHVVPVVSDVVDSFGDLDVYVGGLGVGSNSGPDLSGIIEILKLIIAIIGIAILVFAILKVVDLFKSNKVKVKVQYPEDRNKRE